MQVLIDYLTFTSKIHNYTHFLLALGVANCTFLDMSAWHGWHHRLYYRGISAYFGGREDICIELSGTGCRTVEQVNDNKFDWYSFFASLKTDVLAKDVHVSRLDIAGDDREGMLSFDRMFAHGKHNRYICKARYHVAMDWDEQNIYFGSPKSDRRLRIYNKALEQKLVGEHWIRCEMQMRNDNALSFLLNWLEAKDVGECYAGVLLDFLRFTRKPPDGTHYDRCEIMPWWLRFVGAARSCAQLYLSGDGYTLLDVHRFLEHQAASSLRLWLLANDGDISEIMAMIDGSKLNYRQLQLLDKIRAEEA